MILIEYIAEMFYPKDGNKTYAMIRARNTLEGGWCYKGKISSVEFLEEVLKNIGLWQ